VVFMPVRTLPELVATGIGAGLDPATPAVAVENATRDEERVITAPIGALADRLAAETPSGPIIVMIGRVFAAVTDAAATQSKPQDHQPAALGRAN